MSSLGTEEVISQTKLWVEPEPLVGEVVAEVRSPSPS
jgi:hypothetical protein